MRRVLPPLIAGILAFVLVAAWAVRPGGDTLVVWTTDTAAMQADARTLARGLARLEGPGPQVPAPDIVVIVLDTVRADRMGLYGYDRGTTPRIDAWSSEARVYTEMISDGAWTIPSHASLFTGLAPIEHGARGVPRSSRAVASRLRQGSPTVARALQAHGYDTVGLAANRAFLDTGWGLDQGFELWLCGQLGIDVHKLPYTSADRVTALGTQVLDRERDAPLFLFLNYMDAHAPWQPREGYGRDPAAIDRDVLPYTRRWNTISDALLAGDGLPGGVAEAWSEAYDSELRFLDEHVGALLARIPADTAVFLLSDHGEYLGEHALVEHSKDLYDEVLRVPLVVRAPGHARGRDATPVQTHDVASMILAVAGVAPLAHMERTDGLQVSELYWSRRKDLRNPRYGARFDRIRRAYRQDGHVLLVGGAEEAYELASDPRQLKPVVRAPWAPALRLAGKQWVEARTFAREDPVLEGPDVAALRALGYVE